MLDTINTEHHCGLPVTLTLLISLSPTFLEDYYFLTRSFFFDSGIDSCILDLRSSNGRIVDCSNHKNITDADLLSDLERKLLNEYQVGIEHLYLLTHQANDSEDVIRMGWKGDAFLWAVDVDDRILFRNWLLLSFTQLAPRPPELLSLERLPPLGLFLLVQFVRIHVPYHLSTTLFI